MLLLVLQTGGLIHRVKKNVNKIYVKNFLVRENYF
jgi:hypothetical protein